MLSVWQKLMHNANATAADRVEASLLRFPAYAINLDSRADRWAQVAQEFAQLRWPVTRWSAVQYEKSPNALPTGAAGCLESHRQIWRHALGAPHDTFAVFEDDVVFSGDFKDIFPAVLADLPQDWDVLHLHSFHASTETVTPRVVRFCAQGWGSHGYLLRANVCEKLLRQTSDARAPVDWQLTRGLVQNGGQVYGTSLACTLCFQRGDDSDIPHSAQLHYWRTQLKKHWRAATETAIHEQADVQGKSSTTG